MLRGLTRPLHPCRNLHTKPVLRNTKTPLQSYSSPTPLPEPQDHRRSWFFTAYRVSNFAVIPAATIYCVFFADFGEHEHIFSPARRWLRTQRDAFFSVSSEELELARESGSPPEQDQHNPNPPST